MPVARLRPCRRALPHSLAFGILASRAQLTVLTGYQTSATIGRRRKRTGPLAQIVYDYEFWAGGDCELRSAIERLVGPPRRRSYCNVERRPRCWSRWAHPWWPRCGPLSPIVSVLPCRRRSDNSSIGFAYRREPHGGGPRPWSPRSSASMRRIHLCRCAVSVLPTDADLPPWVERRGFLTDDQLVRFYNDCAIFVLPSHYEGWGLPAAEAMACGAALVVTASGGTADFTADGHNALVVSPRDAGGLAHALTRLVEDPELRNRLGDHRRRREHR